LLILQQIFKVFQCLDGPLNIYLNKCLDIISTLDYFTIAHVSRHNNWLANELAQQALGYHISRGVFFISENPMCACANLKEANVYIADLLAKSAGQEEPLAYQRSDFPADSIGADISEKGSALLSELAGREVSEDPHNSDLLAKSDDGRRPESSKVSNWKKPIMAYLQDPSRKIDKAFRRLAIKYMLVDDDLYRRTADGLLLKCLDEN
jgi:hypothetical protein